MSHAFKTFLRSAKHRLMMPVLALPILLCFVIGTSTAQLARVGPLNPANGFPSWYQDNNGVALDLCVPSPAALQNGACLVAAANLPNPTSPIVFPTNFPDEMFYWNATATMPVNGGKATLVLALEGAFANGGVAPGDQITFARLRIVFDTATAGTYTVTTPFGVKTFTDVPAGRRAVFFTDDVGIAAPGDFAAALQGHIGPFLRPSASPSGTPLPFVVIDNETYVADPGVPVFVTGSPFGTDTFKIEGPDIGAPGVNIAEVSQFSMMGRVHLAPIPSPLAVTRATYVRDAAGNGQVDVFANASAGIGKPSPVLSISAAGISPLLMKKDNTKFFGESVLSSSQSIPAVVTVTNNSDAPPTTATSNVVDEVRITTAVYDAGSKTLLINAASSDQLTVPTFVAIGFGALTNGSLLVDNLQVPPIAVTVISSAGGSSNRNITIAARTASGGNTAPVAQDDNATTLADTAVTIGVLANDTGTAPFTVRLLSSPANGRAALNADNTITYTPNVAFSGNDHFTYIATDANGVDSNIGTVNVVITFVNHAPSPPSSRQSRSMCLPTTPTLIRRDRWCRAQ
jgi:hypothetical protein